jgi:anti-sigma regulatory factor (Ser/Thr protein kinase)
VFDVQEAHSVAVVPAIGPRGAVAALEVFYDAPQSFTDLQRTILALTADQIGNAVERARTRDRENEAAVRLQESMLGPRVLVDGVGHSSRYLAAEQSLQVGGDWHNAQRLGDGRILIAIGDVVGRGLEAATVMGQLRSAVSACALRCTTPTDLLLSLDDFASEIPGAASTTIALAFVDIENQSLHYVCAGHPPPLLVSPHGAVRVLDDAITWPLAIGTRRRSDLGATVEFPPGSLVLMYSDGLVERRGEQLDVGIQRLVDSVARNWNLPLDSLCDRALEDALHDRRRDDDVALLALRSPAAVRDVFLMKTRATPDAVGLVRERLRGWLDDRGLSPEDQLAVLVAVGEACTNAVEHAYNELGRNLFRVEACVRDGSVVACVTDSGAWKDNATRTARGNGLAIMHELMDDVEVDRRNVGTAVTLRYRIGAPDASALQR